jgi:hypothetical protein
MIVFRINLNIRSIKSYPSDCTIYTKNQILYAGAPEKITLLRIIGQNSCSYHKQQENYFDSEFIIDFRPGYFLAR